MGSGWLRHVALNLDVCLPVAGLSNLIRGLHTKKSIHPRAKSLLDPQRHFGRERGAAVEKGRESSSGHAKNLSGLGNGEIKRLDHFHPDELSRMDRACHTHHRFVSFHGNFDNCDLRPPEPFMSSCI